MHMDLTVQLLEEVMLQEKKKKKEKKWKILCPSSSVTAPYGIPRTKTCTWCKYSQYVLCTVGIQMSKTVYCLTLIPRSSETWWDRRIFSACNPGPGSPWFQTSCSPSTHKGIHKRHLRNSLCMIGLPACEKRES